MERITVYPSETWDFFQKHRKELEKEMKEVASNDEYGTTIYITEDEGFPQFVVHEDDFPVLTESILDKRDCEESARRIYMQYLTSSVVSGVQWTRSESGSEEECMSDIEFEIEERELELDDAVWDFFCAVFGDFYSLNGVDSDKIAEDFKEHALRYLYEEHGLDIYRPMYLEDEDGEFFEEYPYEYLDFGEENKDESAAGKKENRSA